MKALSISLTFFFFSSVSTYAQQYSDLYLKVDSLLRYDLKFNVDSAILAKKKRDSSSSNLVIIDAISLPQFPTVIMDEKVVELNQLNKYKLNQIKKIEVIHVNDNPSAVALYGSKGVYGLVYITRNNISAN